MPAKTRLTDAHIKHAPVPASGQAEIWDSTIPGFGVRVTSKGVKSFVLLYRFRGQSRRWTLGRYPSPLSLADARKKADAALRALEAGRDPQGGDAFGPTLETFFTTYCDRQNKPSTAAETRRNMEAIFKKKWADRAIGTLTRADVNEITDKLMEKGKPSAARHAFAHIRLFFSWCVDRGLLEASPLIGLKPPAKAQDRSRALSLPEIVRVYRAAEDSEIAYPFGTIVKLLILTGQRRGEVTGMERGEFDKPSKLWIIPGARTKNGREHPLPIGPMARRIVRTTPRLSDRFLFPARGNDETTFSGWSKAKREIDKLCGVEDWTLHDLRRSTATQLASLGIAPHIVERILNHTSETFRGVAGVYNRFEYRDEMRAALRKWEKHLFAAIKASKPKTKPAPEIARAA